MGKTSMHKGEIWLINLDPTVGAEIKKSRPAVIVSVNEVGVLPLRIIVPITEWKTHYSQAPWLIQIKPNRQNGLDKTSAADTFQIRSLSIERFILAIGKVEDETLMAILDGIKIVIGL
jgi:mRNA interferase MazF